MHLFRACCLEEIEQLYAEALQLEIACCDTSVDKFFEVAVLTASDASSTDEARRDYLHRSALVKLVTAGQEFGRLCPSSHLTVVMDGQACNLPIQRQGFVWSSIDFDRLEPVGNYRTNAVEHKYRSAGAGIPLVVSNTDDIRSPYVNDQASFSATLVMDVGHPQVDNNHMPAELADNVSLTLYDPLRVRRAKVGGKPRVLAKDLTAPIAFRLKNRRSSALDAFIQPGQVEGEGRLFMLEPFQPDKIPVVLIHGLLSDPFTWVQMINELRMNERMRQNFQVWVFEYPTGQPFVLNASRLRSGLHDFAEQLSTPESQRQLENIVLVGHSMGGLIAKLQVTESGDRLWYSIANRPFDEVQLAERGRREFRDAFFFEPSPQVSRVVYIGTPHYGSNYARRLIGRIGSALVRPTPEQQQEHEQLLAWNPGVFSEEVTRRIPTSIEMLDPRSQLLQAMALLPTSERVQSHSIIGERWCLFGPPSDGVVPVASARELHASTERYISGKHGDLNKGPGAVEEVQRILELHYAWVQTQSQNEATLPNSLESSGSLPLRWLDLSGEEPTSPLEEVPSPTPAAVEARHIDASFEQPAARELPDQQLPSNRESEEPERDLPLVVR